MVEKLVSLRKKFTKLYNRRWEKFDVIDIIPRSILENTSERAALVVNCNQFICFWSTILRYLTWWCIQNFEISSNINLISHCHYFFTVKCHKKHPLFSRNITCLQICLLLPFNIKTISFDFESYVKWWISSNSLSNLSSFWSYRIPLD